MNNQSKEISQAGLPDKQNDVYKIRPAGRHLLTIGRDLIKDKYAAIVELVKNSYDAGSPDVIISFNVSEDGNQFQIVIEDHGHGMSRDDVINKWLVPSTDDKQKRKKFGNRTMQGRKGIGRWSAAVLGTDLFLETVTQDGILTEVYIQWDSFENAEFLDDVPILVETRNVNRQQGTRLTIASKCSDINYWTRSVDDKNKPSGYARLEYELSKLISPFSLSNSSSELEADFKILIAYGSLFNNGDRSAIVDIQPIPIIDAFDYSVTGRISRDGKGKLIYQIQKARNTVTEEIALDFDNETGCGELNFDIKVFDRDPESITELIQRSDAFKHVDGSGFGKREARNLLSEYTGVGVYRNGFRIRPLGDPDFDWLKLNKRRVLNPTMCIGSDQVIAYVSIQSEELSGLEEKAARDGLKENDAFERLKNIISGVLKEVEKRRFVFRRKAAVGRKKNRIESGLSKLNPIKNIGEKVGAVLKEADISTDVSQKVSEIIEKQDEKQQRMIEEVEAAIAVYQGQATLGKIVNVVLHEGRKPVGFFVDICPLMRKWLANLIDSYCEETHNKLERAIDDSVFNAKMLDRFYKQLDPLASVQRGRKSHVSLKNAVESARATFQGEFDRNDVSFQLQCEEDVYVECWPQDLQIIFTNLFENSIFWLSHKAVQSKEIRVLIKSKDGNLLYVDIFDNGPGIEGRYIENEVIFEPSFSTKPNGTGLGLAISGEAAARCSLNLMAIESNIGSHFRVELEDDSE